MVEKPFAQHTEMKYHYRFSYGRVDQDGMHKNMAAKLYIRTGNQRIGVTPESAEIHREAVKALGGKVIEFPTRNSWKTFLRYAQQKGVPSINDWLPQLGLMTRTPDQVVM